VDLVFAGTFSGIPLAQVQLDPETRALTLVHALDRLPAARAEAVRVAAGLPGFILSTGCLVPRDSAVEAFAEMRRAC